MMEISNLTFAHRECYEGSQNYGIIKTSQPPKILDDGSILWERQCTKCGYRETSIQNPIVKRGQLTHNHGGYGRHPISRVHRSSRGTQQ